MQTARPTPDTLTREGWCGFHNSAFLVSSKEGWGGPLRNAAGHHERLAPLKPTEIEERGVQRCEKSESNNEHD